MCSIDQDLIIFPAITVEIPTYQSDTFKSSILSATTQGDTPNSFPFSTEKNIEYDWFGFSQGASSLLPHPIEEKVTIFDDSLENCGVQAQGPLTVDTFQLETIKCEDIKTIAKFTKSKIELDCAQMG
jgi:hypothetical protein